MPEAVDELIGRRRQHGAELVEEGDAQLAEALGDDASNSRKRHGRRGLGWTAKLSHESFVSNSSHEGLLVFGTSQNSQKRSSVAHIARNFAALDGLQR